MKPFSGALLMTVGLTLAVGANAFAQMSLPFGFWKASEAGYVQHNSSWGSTATGVSRNLSFPKNVTAGNMIIACVADDQYPGCSVSLGDNRGNTYSSFLTWSGAGGLGDGRYTCYYAANAAAGTTTVSATPDCNNYLVLSVHEVSGIATSSPLDRTGTATGTVTGLTLNVSTTAPVTQPNVWAFIYAIDWHHFQSWSVSAGYSNKYGIDLSVGNYIAFAGEKDVKNGVTGVQSLTVTRSTSGSGSDTWGAAIATFKTK